MFVVAAALFCCSSAGSVEAEAKINVVAMETSGAARDGAAIRHTLTANNTDLNDGAVRAVVPPYTPDSACMAPFSPCSA